jgi:hypothetical protein
MIALFKVIGSSYGVTEEQVRRSLGHRRTSIDLAVMVSFVTLFGIGGSVS